MNSETLIAQQALKIAELEEMLEAHKVAVKKIYNIIYCIGGPLNDNRLNYTPTQQTIFFRISELLDLLE